MNLIISGDDKRIIALERELWFRSKKVGFTMELVDTDEEIEDESEVPAIDEMIEIDPIAPKQLVVSKPKVELAKHKVKPKGRPAKR